MNSKSNILLNALSGLGDVGMVLLIVPALVISLIELNVLNKFMKFSPTDGMVFFGVLALFNYLICIIIVGVLFFS